MAAKRTKKATKRTRTAKRKPAPRTKKRTAKAKTVAHDGLTQSALARAIGYTTRQVQRWDELGLPTEGQGRSRRYRLPVVIAWLIDHKVQAKEPSTFDEARARREKAEAQRAELRLARERAELVAVELYESDLNAVVSQLSAGLKSFPSRWAPQLVGLETVVKARGALERGIRELMADLNQTAKDVPPPVAKAATNGAAA